MPEARTVGTGAVAHLAILGLCRARKRAVVDVPSRRPLYVRENDVERIAARTTRRVLRKRRYSIETALEAFECGALPDAELVLLRMVLLERHALERSVSELPREVVRLARSVIARLVRGAHLALMHVDGE